MTLLTGTPGIEIQGQGTDVVLLHGWGMHAGIWQPVAAQLSQRFRVTLIDLPGHGYSPLNTSAYSLDEVTRLISPAVPPASIIIGWSMGGLIAMQLALTNPEKITRLVLVASSARFTRPDRHPDSRSAGRHNDWPHAMEPAMLKNFAALLHQNHDKTVRRFLALQLHGSENERRVLHELLRLYGQRPPPRPTALKGGLAILANSDLRVRLPDITVPTCLIYGQHDRIVPAAVGNLMQSLLPAARQYCIRGAGHAPFLSHPDAFLKIINDFVTLQQALQRSC